MTAIEAVLLAVALAAGNFTYALLFSFDLESATERSFFQAVALFFAWWIYGK